MPKRQPPYAAAFRAAAVALVSRTGNPLAEVAADLGGSRESLQQWRPQATIAAGAGPPGALTTDERA